MDVRRRRLESVRLYALLTEAQCRGDWLETAARLLDGGVDVLQLREKELDGAELLHRAGQLRELCRRHGALLIINDRPDAAVLAGADGVHLGQDDLPPEEVRKLVGPHMLIGLSTHTQQQARDAQRRGVDYIGVGPVYPSATKRCGEGGGPQFVAAMCASTSLPTVAIGGLNPDNITAVVAAGASAVAACAALCSSPDPCAAAQEFLEHFE